MLREQPGHKADSSDVLVPALFTEIEVFTKLLTNDITVKRLNGATLGLKVLDQIFPKRGFACRTQARQPNYHPSVSENREKLPAGRVVAISDEAGRMIVEDI